LIACPRCSHKIKTTAHILQCPQQSTQLQWELRELETHTDVIEDISSDIKAWRLQTKPPAMVTQAGKNQTNLSWDNLELGFIHRSWHMIQMLYYKQQKSNKSSHNCSLTLLQQIIKIARGQWDHCNEVPHQSNTQLVLDLSANIKINTQYDLGPIDLPKGIPNNVTSSKNHHSKSQSLRKSPMDCLLESSKELPKKVTDPCFTSQQQLFWTWLTPEEHPRPTPPPDPDPSVI